jgi:hypothetical protein
VQKESKAVNIIAPFTFQVLRPVMELGRRCMLVDFLAYARTESHNSRPELHTFILHLIIVGKCNNSYTYDLLALTMIACCVLQCAGSR